MKRFAILLTISLLLLLIGKEQIVWGGEGATFAATNVTIDFPESIAFESHVSSTDAPIVKAQFIYYLDRYGAADSTTRKNLEITPGQDVTLQYTWDTSDLTVVPWTPIVYRWRVTDAQGNTFETSPQRIEYADSRFDWQSRQNQQVIVLWHDKPQVFGDKVFDIAGKAIEKQQQLFDVQLGIPIRIIVYNNLDEFNAWHSVALDWVGGEAFPDFGITTQIVTSPFPDDYWLNAVVPHEIAHLYLYQAAYNPAAPLPVWLNEGIAQYSEFIKDDSGFLVEEAAKNSELIPLTSLADGFGQHDETRIRLAYAEALSAVTYLVNTYGESGLARLIAAYKAGKTTDEAFREALGVDMGTFQQDWAEWLGAPRESMVTPTPWALPTFRPTPTLMTLHAKTTPTPVVAPTKTTTPTATATFSATPTFTPTPTPSPPANPPTIPFCGGLLWVLPLPLAAVMLRRQIRRKKMRTIFSAEEDV